MSIYLGSDISGNKLLHIASGQKNIAEMKTPSVDTVFHSSLEYLTFTSYPGVLSAAANNYKLLTVSAADRLAIGDKAIIIVDMNGKIVDGKLKYYYAVYPYNLYTEVEGVWKDATSMYLVPDSNTIVGPCTVYAVNIVNGSYVAPIKGTNEIIINNSTINVNGIALTDFNYIHSTPINDVDATASYLSKTFQMVNSQVSGSMSIFSNGVYSSINKGNNSIFSTLTGKSIRYLFSASIALPGNNSFTVNYVFPTAVSTNAFIGVVPSYDTTISNTTLLVPVGLTNINYREVYLYFPVAGALLWYYDVISSTGTGVTFTRSVISSTGGTTASAGTVLISVFG